MQIKRKEIDLGKKDLGEPLLIVIKVLWEILIKDKQT